ncbi:hypothetical protein ACSBR1_035843 [Camellia fascicularis]
MSSEYYSLCILGSGFSTSLPSLEFILCIFLIAAVFGFYLAPGGLAWALSKARAEVQSRSAIPGPSGLPIIGLVFAFTGSLTHRVLANLANTFEVVPLMAFSIGFTRFIISSHPDTAKDILSSSAFANRPVKKSAYELLFHRAMGFAPYVEYWRNLRRISSTHLFSPKRITCFGDFRQKRGIEMVNQVKGLMEKNGVVEIKRVLHFGSLNNVMMSVFGRSYDFNGCNGLELEGLVSERYELLGIFNWSDHFPLLGLLDLQGVRKRCRELVSRVNVFVGKIIEEHRFKRAKIGGVVGGGDDDDFVDVLLDLENDNKLSDSDMIAVLWLKRLEVSISGLCFKKTKDFRNLFSETSFMALSGLIHQHIIVKILVELLNTQILELWGIVHLFILLELTHLNLVRNFLERCKIWLKNSRT